MKRYRDMQPRSSATAVCNMRRLLVANICLMAACLGTSLGHAAEGEKTLTEQRWNVLVQLAGIEVKERGGDVVQALVFFDPNCPVCARLWMAWYGPTGRGTGLVTRWIPVADMNERSRGRAASLLMANSSAALANNFIYFDHHSREGAAAPTAVTAAVLARMHANEAEWEAIAAATPLIVYRTRDGRVMAQIGMPSQQHMEVLLSSLRSPRLSVFGQTK